MIIYNFFFIGKLRRERIPVGRTVKQGADPGGGALGKCPSPTWAQNKWGECGKRRGKEEEEMAMMHEHLQVNYANMLIKN